MRSRTRWNRGGLSALSPFACAAILFLKSCGGATPIRELLDDPSRFEGKTVRVAGEVRESAGALGVGAYRVDDGTGTLPVVSQANGVPRTGAKVGVEGTFHAAYTIGNHSGAVLLETRRRSQ